MSDELQSSSLEYFLIKSLAQKLQNSDHQQLQDKFEEGNRIYLDDDLEVLRAFVSIVEDISEEAYEKGPNHLKGDLRDITTDKIREIYKEHRITTYGRSGMTLNTPELKKFLD